MLRIKLSLLTVFFALSAFLAQMPPPPPPPLDDGTGDGGGVTGTGTGIYQPSSNIDQFLYVLFFIAVAVIFYVQYKKAQKQRKKRYTTSYRHIKMQKAKVNKL